MPDALLAPRTAPLAKTPPSAPSVANAAQFLYFGFQGAVTGDGEKATHFSALCGLAASPLYKHAYDRWNAAQLPAWSVTTKVNFPQRALIGMSDPNLFETGITMNPVYGVPIIPGSALKGLARATAKARGVDNKEIDRIFGHEQGMPATNVQSGAAAGHAPSAKSKTAQAAGLVRVMDAWWIPGSAPGDKPNNPFVREQATPHHKDFADNKGQKGVAATPFDSPIPLAQIAADGQFLLVVQGHKPLAEYAMACLVHALATEGVGARTPEYGRALPIP